MGRMLWSSSYTTIVMCLGLGSAHPRILYEGPSVKVDVRIRGSLRIKHELFQKFELVLGLSWGCLFGAQPITTTASKINRHVSEAYC